jgi:hypothetical protein
MTRSIAGAAGVLLLLTAGAAHAELIRFMHPHPMPPSMGKGMCHIEGPHFHSFKPHKPLLYVEVEGHWAFIGDPVEYEPEGPKYAYYGHHPIFWVEGDPGEVHHYCYITGPHYHYYAPPPDMKFKVKGGVYWWVGAHPKWYRTRYKRYRPVDRYYASVHIARPVVTVAPPAGYVGVVIGPGGRTRVHGVVHGGVHVVPPPPPRVNVNIRLPGVGVVFGGPPPPRGVIVHHRGPRYHRVRHVRRRHYRVHRGRGHHKWGKRKHRKRRRR